MIAGLYLRNVHANHDFMDYASVWKDSQTGIYDKEFDWEPLMSIRPLKDISRKLGLSTDMLSPNSTATRRTDDYFKNIWSDDMIASMNVPCYFVSGWYDDSLKGALDHFPALTHDHPNVKSRKNHKLLIGRGHTRCRHHSTRAVSSGILITDLNRLYRSTRRR